MTRCHFDDEPIHMEVGEEPSTCQHDGRRLVLAGIAGEVRHEICMWCNQRYIVTDADEREFIPVSTRMVSYTVPCVEDLETPQQLVAYCARVSNPKNQNSHETADKLIKYLIRNAHWSPLEMVDVTMEIVVQRDIGRQILRHRSFSFQEFSQRYAEALGFSAPREARLQDETNRQNSLPCLDIPLSEEWNFRQQAVIELAEETYQWALDNGLAKEVARVVLPEGLTMSRMYMKGSLRSWIHYLQVREDATTQKEHRDLAMAIAAAIATVWTVR